MIKDRHTQPLPQNKDLLEVMKADQYSYHKLTLKFLDPKTEAQYHSITMERTIVFCRIAWGMAIVLGGGFGLLDHQMFGENADIVLLARSIFMLLSAVILILTYVKKIKKYMNWNPSVLVLLISLLSIFLIIMDDHPTFSPYFAGMLMGFISIFSMTGHGFRLIFPTFLLIFAVFNVTFALIAPISPQLLILYNFFLLTMILVLSYALYLVERLSRENFIKNAELIDSLAQVRKLGGMLPICANCKKIRDDQGYWNQIESYIREHSEADFSHSICPDCSAKLYPNLYPSKAKQTPSKNSIK